MSETANQATTDVSADWATQVVTYTAPGRPVHDGILRTPRSNPSRVAVLLLHGSGAVPVPSDRPRPSRIMLEPWAEHYAAHGLASFNIAFTLTEPPGPVYPAQVVDAKNAVQYLRMNAGDLGIDADRIVVQGHSGGARMGGNVIVSPDDPFFHASGSWPDVSDAANGFIGFYGAYSGVTAVPAAYPVFYGGPRDSDDPAVRERWEHANSLAQAAKASGPVLLIHGDADPVPLALSQAMEDRLRESGVEVKLVVFKDCVHAFDLDIERFGPPAQWTEPGALSEQGLAAADLTLDWIHEHFTS